MTRTTQQMFVVPATDSTATQDQVDRERRAAKAEARLDEPLTRREVLDALESVADEFGTSDARNMVLRLMEALR